LSSALLGFILGWICWTTRSVWPGMILHAINNGLLLSLIYVGPRLQERGFDIAGQKYLPVSLVLTTTVIAAVAAGVLAITARQRATVQTAPA